MRIFRFLALLTSVVLLLLPQGPLHAQSGGPWGTYERPFNPRSPWNMRPVSPVLDSYEIPPSSFRPLVAAGAYSTGVFLASASDPPVEIHGIQGRPGVRDVDSEAARPVLRIPRWPSNVKPAPGTDGHAEVVDPVAGVVHSFWKLTLVDGTWRAALYAWSRLDGAGWGEPGHYYQGARATGVPTMAGLIRKHEVGDGQALYRHALAMSMAHNGLSSDPTYVFPATSADFDAARTNTGKIPQGALMMLPADYDSSGVNPPALRKVVETLKVYGAYVVDRNVGTPFFIYVEHDSDFNIRSAGSQVFQELDKIRRSLRRVVSAKGWIDGDGRDAPAPSPAGANMMSMRGNWRLDKGTGEAAYETWQQAVVFRGRAAGAEAVATNNSNRNIATTQWGTPVAGQRYTFSVLGSEGARLRLTLLGNAGSPLYDSGEIAQGGQASFVWPAGPLVRSRLTAYSGTKAGEAEVRGQLR